MTSIFYSMDKHTVLSLTDVLNHNGVQANCTRIIGKRTERISRMTQKHCIALAATARRLLDEMERNAIMAPARNLQGVQVEPHRVVSTELLRVALISALADFCATQHPAFKRDRWLAHIAGECRPNGGNPTVAPLMPRPSRRSAGGS